jgi:hypothetical protein
MIFGTITALIYLPDLQEDRSNGSANKEVTDMALSTKYLRAASAATLYPARILRSVEGSGTG